MILFYSAYLAVRRAMLEDRRPRSRPPMPLWRLVAGEVAHLVGRIARSQAVRVVAVAAGAVLAAEVGLSTQTPGPTLESTWRRGTAGAAAAILVVGCCALFPVARSTPERSSEPSETAMPRRRGDGRSR